MIKNRYQVWTSDMVIGAAIVIIGVVATLVRWNILVMKWSVTMPPLVVHLWPLLLIGIGVLLVFEYEEQREMRERQYLRNGERQ